MSGRLLYDGVPVEVVGWDTKNGATVVDIDLADGRTKWAYWPSPRFTVEPEGTVATSGDSMEPPEGESKMPTTQQSTQKSSAKSALTGEALIGKQVFVTIFDGHIKNQAGLVFGCGKNTAGECVYLVEMENQKPTPGGKYEGTEQLKHGKKWVLSLYPDEIRAA